jgi:hypothetical protein
MNGTTTGNLNQDIGEDLVLAQINAMATFNSFFCGSCFSLSFE